MSPKSHAYLKGAFPGRTTDSFTTDVSRLYEQEVKQVGGAGQGEAGCAECRGLGVRGRGDVATGEACSAPVA